jgi:hypothetical protein
LKTGYGVQLSHRIKLEVLASNVSRIVIADEGSTMTQQVARFSLRRRADLPW